MPRSVMASSDRTNTSILRVLVDTADRPRPLRSMRVFISHTSRDAELAGALIDLIRAALNLGASEVRCTSVDGYRLPAGADTDEVLRREVFTAHAFIGLLTPSSVSSAYVLFELGARWGAGEDLFPLLARGAVPAMLPGPLAGKNALNLAAGAQVHQFLAELAGSLKSELDAPAAYERHLRLCVDLAAQLDDEASPPDSLPPKRNAMRLRSAYLCGASFGNRIGLVPISPEDAESGELLGELLDAAEVLGVRRTQELRRYARGEVFGDARTAVTEAQKKAIRQHLDRFLVLLASAEADVVEAMTAGEIRWFTLGATVHKIGALALAGRESGDTPTGAAEVAQQLDVLLEILDLPPTLARMLHGFSSLAALPDVDAEQLYLEGNCISSTIFALLNTIAASHREPRVADP